MNASVPLLSIMIRGTFHIPDRHLTVEESTRPDYRYIRYCYESKHPDASEVDATKFLYGRLYGCTYGVADAQPEQSSVVGELRRSMRNMVLDRMH